MSTGKLWFLVMAAGVAALCAGCFGSRYVSADPDLEEIYIGRSYYDIVGEYGRPDATAKDGMGGTTVAYNSVSLRGTVADTICRQYTVRNKATRVSGTPRGGMTFRIGADLKCYAVESDFERNRVKEPKPEKAAKRDLRKPDPIKPIVPRTLNFPYYESNSPYAEVVSIQKIEVTQEQTKVYFLYRDRTPVRRPANDYGIYIMPETYLENCATGHRYKLSMANGISIYPEHTHFSHNEGGYDVLVYSLTFRGVPPEVEYINIVEPGHSGFNFYKVDVRTPVTTKEELKNL
ncbi:MAG: hypothetical protein K5650_00640 [Bacteroidales bacterium]|nr:hypothetical protein [Bacteroidales bacterium]